MRDDGEHRGRGRARAEKDFPRQAHMKQTQGSVLKLNL